MDTGPIIAQDVVFIYEGESLESVTEALQKVEHRLYPRVIKNEILRV